LIKKRDFERAYSAKQLASVVEDLLDKKISNKVFITGGTPSYTENALRNTLENVTEALKVLDFFSYSTILFVFKTHAAGRGYLTLKKYASPVIIATWIF
jgi:hypothetical protein